MSINNLNELRLVTLEGWKLVYALIVNEVSENFKEIISGLTPAEYSLLRCHYDNLKDSDIDEAISLLSKTSDSSKEESEDFIKKYFATASVIVEAGDDAYSHIEYSLDEATKNDAPDSWDLLYFGYDAEDEHVGSDAYAF